MKRKTISLLLLAFIMVLTNSIYANTYAMIVDLIENTTVTPYYTTILWVSNGLKHESDGKLICQGDTNVQQGYIAGVKMELQKLSDSWTTIKTWDSTSDDSEMYLYKEWYVVRGTYRLKLTHTALNSSGRVVETVIKYSNIVTY
ncbi:MAG: hypothetical protein PHT02_06350 [Tissierellia bacterium]|nr:hypothetical protein [Tissierellia bacterium]